MVKRFTSILLSLIVVKCFSLNVCCASNKYPSLPFKIKTELCREAGEAKYNFAAGACLLTLMFLGVYQAQIDQMPETLKSQFKPQNIALNFASTYCMNFAATFFHEFGHGIAKKMLKGCDFKIHLGKNSSQITWPIIDLKYLSIDGFDSMSGFNSSESNKLVKYTSLQKILINLAGGASGILGYYFLRTFIFFIYNFCEQENTQILQNLGNALSQAVTVDQVVLNQLFNMFIPMQNANVFGGDAAKIWQELGIKKNIIKSVADVQPYLQILAFIALSFKQAKSNKADQRYIADKILIGLANYFLQSFVQFKSA